MVFYYSFEIIITFSGASSSTGQITEERTSYLSKEVAWGHRFVNIVEYDKINREYLIDYGKFEMTVQVGVESIVKSLING